MGMNMNKEYEIVDSSDKLFCKCMRTEDGAVQLISKNASITLDELHAMSGFLALMNASPKDIEKLEGAISSCDGAAENMAEVMQDNLSGQITILKSQIQELAISFGDALMPMIRRIVSAVQRFIDMLNNMSDGTRNFILRIGMLVAATGPFLFVLGTIISKTGTAIKGFTSFAGLLGKVSTKFGGLKGVLGKVGAAIGGISAPVAIAAAAIAVLAGAFFYLWKTNKKFRQNITTIWNSIKKTIVTFVNEIKSKLGGIGTEFSMALAVIKKVWSEASKVLAPLFERGFKAVSIVLSTVLNTILGVLDVFLGIFNGNWKQAWEGIKTIFSSVWSGIKGMLSLNLGVIKSILMSVLSFISSKWRGIWSGIKAFAVGLWSSLKQSASNIWTSIKNAVLRPVTSLKSNLSSIWNGIKSTVSSVWQSIGNQSSDAFDDTSLVLPPADIIKYFNLKYNTADSSWETSDNNKVLICNNNKTSYFTDSISSTVLIKKEFFDDFANHNYLKYFAFSERFVPGTGIVDESSLHFEIINGEINKEILNYGDNTPGEPDINPLCEECPHELNKGFTEAYEDISIIYNYGDYDIKDFSE